MTGTSINLEQLRDEASRCNRCQLAKGRNRVVFGEGPADARIMFLGEAPGRREDETGRPFCGRSGLLLDQMLQEAGIDRSQVFVTSIVKCRPPNNRDPKSAEIASCSGWLGQQLNLIQPDFICTLGNFALRSIRGDRTGITQVHGKPEERELDGRAIMLFPLFHPAAALRSTKTKNLLGEDLRRLAQLTS
jgi:DNA polymerase